MRDEVRFNSLFKQYLINALVLLAVLTIFGCQQNIVVESELDRRSLVATMYQKYASEFPQVKSIAVEDLQQLQQQEKNIVLVDVRSPKEREVSIIPGAISIEEFEENLAHYSNRDSMMVAYCTIGYRSGKYAQKLRQQGINIFNLEGSLLAWSHSQGELVNDSGSTKQVHVYDRQWELTADNYQPVW